MCIRDRVRKNNPQPVTRKEIESLLNRSLRKHEQSINELMSSVEELKRYVMADVISMEQNETTPSNEDAPGMEQSGGRFTDSFDKKDLPLKNENDFKNFNPMLNNETFKRDVVSKYECTF